MAVSYIFYTAERNFEQDDLKSMITAVITDLYLQNIYAKEGGGGHGKMRENFSKICAVYITETRVSGHIGFFKAVYWYLDTLS